jgi:hypothetical protein
MKLFLHNSGMNNKNIGISFNRPMYKANNPIIFPALRQTCDQIEGNYAKARTHTTHAGCVHDAITNRSTRESPAETITSPNDKAS